MEKDHESLIKTSLRYIETGNPFWAAPALKYLEDTKPGESMKYTLLYVKQELLMSQNEAKDQWEEYLNQLEIIIEQKDYDLEKLSKQCRVIWFYRLNYSNWSKLVSSLYAAEGYFRRQNLKTCIGQQASAWDFINEGEYGEEKEEKLKAINAIINYANSVSTE